MWIGCRGGHAAALPVGRVHRVDEAVERARVAIGGGPGLLGGHRRGGLQDAVGVLWPVRVAPGQGRERPDQRGRRRDERDDARRAAAQRAQNRIPPARAQLVGGGEDSRNLRGCGLDLAQRREGLDEVGVSRHGDSGLRLR